MNLKRRGKRFLVLAGVLAAGLLPGAGIADGPPVKDERVLLEIPYQQREIMQAEMRGNLELVRRLFVAYVESDFAEVAKVADLVGVHKGRAQNVVRRGNQAFTDMAVNFHAGTREELHQIAQSKDQKRLAAAISSTLLGCQACHATWRVTEWPDKIYPMPSPLAKLNLPPGVKMYDKPTNN